MTIRTVKSAMPLREAYELGLMARGVHMPPGKSALTLYDTALKAFIYLPNLLIPAGALRLWHIREEFSNPDTRTRALTETALFSVATAFVVLIRSCLKREVTMFRNIASL